MAQPVYRWLKPAVFTGCLAPLLVLAFRVARKDLGPNIIEEMLNQFGLVALVLLWASLFCSPLKKTLGWTWPMRLRRMVGLFAFFYACLHFLTYTVVDQGLAWGTLVEDVLKRKFILVGFLAFLTLIPLAVTSTNSMIKRLGHARWSRLHQLVYLSAILASIHFLLRVKSDLRQPLVYAAVLVVLLAARFGMWLRSARSL